MQQRKAIVLAMFGTTVEAALKGLLAIKTAMETAYPQTPVRLAFTSNQIRRIWRQRAADPAYLQAHPDIPQDILDVQGILAAIANLQDQGFDTLVVQPTHVAPAEEFHDLAAYVRGLASIRTMKPRWQPFKTIALGRPLLGAYNLAPRLCRRHPHRCPGPGRRRRPGKKPRCGPGLHGPRQPLFSPPAASTWNLRPACGSSTPRC